MTIDAARMRTESVKGLGSDLERMLAFRRVGGVGGIDLSTVATGDACLGWRIVRGWENSSGM
jgi:hypothetical protein